MTQMIICSSANVKGQGRQVKSTEFSFRPGISEHQSFSSVWFGLANSSLPVSEVGKFLSYIHSQTVYSLVLLPKVLVSPCLLTLLVSACISGAPTL